MSAFTCICVTGPDGSGKTTQIGKIAERLERARKKKVVVVTIWDLLLDPKTKHKVGFESPAEVDAYLSVLTSTSRALFLYHCFQEALELARRRPADLYLVNSYWYKYYATEIAHGGDATLLLALADRIFPEPALTFYLRLTPEEAARRKVQFSGYESGFPASRTGESFIAFQKKAHATLEGLADSRHWRTLNGTESVDALTEAILAQIERSC